MSIMILVDMQVKPECISQMKHFLKEVLPDTRSFQGCQLVDLYQDQDDPNHLMFYEHWEQRSDYEKYLAWREETGVLAQFISMLNESREIQYFDKVDNI